MKILVISGAWPFVAGAARGAEVALYEILRLLASEQGFDVAYAQAGIDQPPLKPSAQSGINDLVAAGVRVLPAIRFDEPKPTSVLRRSYERLFGNSSIPGLGQEDKINAVCRAANWIPDAVVPVWSDIATAAASRLPWPVFAYCGNPYHKVVLANLRLEWHFERCGRPYWLVRHAFARLAQKRIAHDHIASMRRLEFVGDVHANDTDYYRSVGVNAHYLRSMWPRLQNGDWSARRDSAEQFSPLKVAASVAAVPSTANTFGLWALGEEILPALKRRLGSGRFELHVYGAGKPRAFLEPILNDPAIILRGFVDDLDAELYSCPVYLVANNRYSYKAGHNRFLHAWSLGACIVTWRDSTLAMPELIHDENVLLADTADDLAAHIERAACDTHLRRRLGEAGRATVLKYYQPEMIVAEMARRIRNWTPRSVVEISRN